MTSAVAGRPALRWLLVAPHRLFFCLAMLSLVAVSLWWTAQLLGRTGAFALPTAVPPTWLHGWSMLAGFMPLFMFGFLFTAGPKWLNVQPPTAASLAPAAALAFGGVVLALLASFADATLTAAAVAATVPGWLLLLARFAALVWRSRAPDRVHAVLVLVFLTIGTLGNAVYAWGLAMRAAGAVHAATMLMVWCFVAPLYVTVTHRLIPFFTANVVPRLDAWRPLWLLVALVVVVLAHGVLPLGLLLWSTATLDLLRLAVDVAGALLVLLVAWRWGVVQSLRNRLLAMLHLGFVWLGLAFALYAWNTATGLLGQSQAGLGLAPLHALTMGFFGTVMLAMVTRVTAGHSGRQLVADDATWTLFLALQVAVLLRIGGAVWSAAAAWLLAGAALVWTGLFTAWALRCVPLYLKARADGRPG